MYWHRSSGMTCSHELANANAYCWLAGRPPLSALSSARADISVARSRHRPLALFFQSKHSLCARLMISWDPREQPSMARDHEASTTRHPLGRPAGERGRHRVTLATLVQRTAALQVGAFLTIRRDLQLYGCCAIESCFLSRARHYRKSHGQVEARNLSAPK